MQFIHKFSYFVEVNEASRTTLNRWIFVRIFTRCVACIYVSKMSMSLICRFVQINILLPWLTAEILPSMFCIPYCLFDVFIICFTSEWFVYHPAVWPKVIDWFTVSGIVRNILRLDLHNRPALGTKYMVVTLPSEALAIEAFNVVSEWYFDCDPRFGHHGDLGGSRQIITIYIWPSINYLRTRIVFKVL